MDYHSQNFYITLSLSTTNILIGKDLENLSYLYCRYGRRVEGLKATTAAESSMVYVSCRVALSDWRNVIEVVSLAADPCWNHLPLALCQPQLPDPTGRYDPDPQNPRIKHQLGFPTEVWSALSDMVSHTAWRTSDVYIKSVIYQLCRASLCMRNEITCMCCGKRMCVSYK